MGEALLTRPGGADGGSSGGKTLMTEIITEDKLWTVPKAKNQSFSVRIFGGGGCGGSTGSGGGGWMNNSILDLTAGEVIDIKIGPGGMNNYNSYTGGTTLFGRYLSALGGMSGIGGNASVVMGTTIYYNRLQSSGGSGGASIISDYTMSSIGFQFGGGATTITNMSLGSGSNNTFLGYGGKWGGAGGICISLARYANSYLYQSNIEDGIVTENGYGGIEFENDQDYYNAFNKSYNFGDFGNRGFINNSSYTIYGGNVNNVYIRQNFYKNLSSSLSNIFNSSEDGINTSANAQEIVRGNGTSNNELYLIYNKILSIPAGGGYGGSITISSTATTSSNAKNMSEVQVPQFYLGGGGGYGANGGSSLGGGGGYSGSGGNGFLYIQDWGYGLNARTNGACGGGGGYGKGGDGYVANASAMNNTSDVANMKEFRYSGYVDSNGSYGGGGGSVWPSSESNIKNILNVKNCSKGGNGICIIQYYV